MNSHRGTRRRTRPAGFVLAALTAVFCLTAIPAMAADTGWLGVNLQPLDDDLREAMGLDRRVRGALVSRVVSGSPAEAAGLRADDVIVEVAGRRVSSVDQAVEAVRARTPGENVRVVVNRRGAERGMTVELGALARAGLSDRDRPVIVGENDGPRRVIIHGDDGHRRIIIGGDDEDDDRKDVKVYRWKSDDDSAAPKVFEWRSDDDDDSEAPEAFEWRGDEGDDEGNVIIVRPKRMKEEMRAHAEEFRRHAEEMGRRFTSKGSSGAFLGVTSQELTGELAEYFGVEEGEGVLVTSVVDGSAAEEAGLRAGDVILAVDGDEVTDPDDLRDAISGHEPGDAVEIRISRDRSPRTVRAELGTGAERSEFRFFAPEPPVPPRMLREPRAPKAPRALELDLPHPEDLRLHVLRGLDEEHLQKLQEELGRLRDLSGLDEEHMERLHEKLQYLHEGVEPHAHDMEAKMRELETKLRDLERKLRELERKND